jgi:phytoene/squalene synthetase
VFDAERRGRLISAVELEHYTRWLAIAVTEALHYFIGNRCGAPQNEMRHMAALGAHVTHMLRDTVEDIESGYFNMPLEVVQRAGIDAHDVYSTVYRAWVAQRVYLARQYFEAGRKHLEQVENWRCRLAGYAYITRFEIVLDLIEADNYILRRDYPERKTLNAGIKMFWGALLETLFAPKSAVSTRYMSGEIRKVI